MVEVFIAFVIASVFMFVFGDRYSNNERKQFAVIACYYLVVIAICVIYYITQGAI